MSESGHDAAAVGSGSAPLARKRFVPPAPPRTPKAAATRLHLLSVAGDLFIDRGYDAVSLNDIADAAGLTKGAIYGHFRSKGQLLVEVIHWKLAEREHEPAYLEAAAHHPDSSALLIDRAGTEARLLQVDAAAAGRHDADVASGMQELYAERTRAIRDAVALAADPDLVTFVLESLSYGIGTQEALGREMPDRDRWVAVFAAALEALFPVGTPPDAVMD